MPVIGILQHLGFLTALPAQASFKKPDAAHVLATLLTLLRSARTAMN